MGQRFPTAAQTPYFNMNDFTYPAAYTTGSLGAYVLQAPAILWNQCFASKSWRFLEKYKITLRVDGPRSAVEEAESLPRLIRHTNTSSPALGPGSRVRLGIFSNFGSAGSQRPGVHPRGILMRMDGL